MNRLAALVMAYNSMKTCRCGFVCLFAIFITGGCRVLPKVSLESCIQQDTTHFVQLFASYFSGDSMRCRYMLDLKSMTLNFEGIVQKQENVIFLAGFNDSGITLFSARWAHGKFVILKNNTRMPEQFLKCVLTDLMLPYYLPMDTMGCVYTNISDNSLWLHMKDNPGNIEGYYVIENGHAAWNGLKQGRLCYRADISTDDSSGNSVIDIDHLDYCYRAKMIILSDAYQRTL
jgi:hypothetical protein